MTVSVSIACPQDTIEHGTEFWLEFTFQNSFEDPISIIKPRVNGVRFYDLEIIGSEQRTIHKIGAFDLNQNEIKYEKIGLLPDQTFVFKENMISFIGDMPPDRYHFSFIFYFQHDVEANTSFDIFDHQWQRVESQLSFELIWPRWMTSQGFTQSIEKEIKSEWGKGHRIPTDNLIQRIELYGEVGLRWLIHQLDGCYHFDKRKLSIGWNSFHALVSMGEKAVPLFKSYRPITDGLFNLFMRMTAVQSSLREEIKGIPAFRLLDDVLQERLNLEEIEIIYSYHHPSRECINTISLGLKNHTAYPDVVPFHTLERNAFLKLVEQLYENRYWLLNGIRRYGHPDEGLSMIELRKSGDRISLMEMWDREVAFRPEFERLVNHIKGLLPSSGN